jgi:hypothetical protein
MTLWKYSGDPDLPFSARWGELVVLAKATYNLRPLRVYVLTNEGDAFYAGLTDASFYPSIPVRQRPRRGWHNSMLVWVFAGRDIEDFPVGAARGHIQYDKPTSMADEEEMYGDPYDASKPGRVQAVCELLRHFFIPEGTMVHYILPEGDIRQKNGQNFISQKTTDWMRSYLKTLLWKAGDEGKVKKWTPNDIKDAFFLRYNTMGMAFSSEYPNPAQTVDPAMGTLNTYLGSTKDQHGYDLAAEKALRQSSPYHDLFHLYVVRCGCDVRTYLLLYLYLAQNAQDPSKRIESIISLTGPQATFKTQDMYRWSCIFPNDNILNIDSGNMNDLIGHSTAKLSDKVVVLMDEASELTSQQNAALKQLVTSKRKRERMLYQNPMDVPIPVGLLLATCEQEHLAFGSNSLFGRRDFTVKAAKFWDHKGDGLDSDWYATMYFNFYIEGEISRHEHGAGAIKFEDLSVTDVMRHPGILSSYEMRLLPRLPKLSIINNISPCNMVTLQKQLSIADGRKVINTSALVFNMLRAGSVMMDTQDYAGFWEFARSTERARSKYPDRRHFLLQAIAQVVIKEWIATVDAFRALVETHSFYAHLPGMDQDWDGLVPLILRRTCDNFPVQGAGHFFPVPGEGDPFGRSLRALKMLRSLFDVTMIGEEDTQARLRALNDETVIPVDDRIVYVRYLSRLRYLDDEMSKAGGDTISPFFKMHVISESVFLRCVVKAQRMSMNRLWDQTFGEGTYKDLGVTDVCDENGNLLELYHDKIERLIETGEFANHVWRMQARVLNFGEQRREGSSDGKVTKSYVMIVPCFTVLREKFIQSRVPDSKMAYTVFAPNSLFSASADELAYCTGLKDHLDPFCIAYMTAMVTLGDDYTSFDDLVRKVVFGSSTSILNEGDDEPFTYAAHEGMQDEWRRKWDVFDNTGFVEETRCCPFGVFPTKFSLLPRFYITASGDGGKGKERI